MLFIHVGLLLRCCKSCNFFVIWRERERERESIWYSLDEREFDGIDKHMSSTNTCMSDQHIECDLQFHRFIIRTSHSCQGLRRCRLSCYPLLPHHLLQPRHPVKILWCHALTICLFRINANNPSVWFLHVLVHISGGLFQGIGIARSSENLMCLCCISVCRVFPRMHLAVVDIPCSDRRCWSQ